MHLSNLKKEQNMKSKIRNIKYSSLSPQKYISELSYTQSTLLANLRSRMVNLKINFKSKYSNYSCPFPECTHEDSQDALLSCDPLLKHLSHNIKPNVKYEHIFSSNIKKQKQIVNVMFELLSICESLLSQRKTE